MNALHNLECLKEVLDAMKIKLNVLQANAFNEHTVEADDVELW